ncbi:hypothetical protein NUW54_g14356 [Trametes sanguinea]|uniref:Uncharacterized protein n=1 Tax=Trametes sanguinea TaxID=158606 RepID=A0ACC1MCR2_9APHY|nr:hypothetical protein NUW54_g14356 [Trametes sanguinea]
MSQQRPYPAWPAGVKSEQHQYSGISQGDMASGGYPSVAYGHAPSLNSTSSLSGAMGDAQLGVQPRASATPPSGLASWTPSPTSSTMSGSFMAVPDDPSLTYMPPVTPVPSASPSGAFGGYPPYNVPLSQTEVSPGLTAAQCALSQAVRNFIGPGLRTVPMNSITTSADNDVDVLDVLESIHAPFQASQSTSMRNRTPQHMKPPPTHRRPKGPVGLTR